MDIIVIVFACMVDCATISISGDVYAVTSLEACEQQLPAILEEFREDDPTTYYSGECRKGDILDKIKQRFSI